MTIYHGDNLDVMTELINNGYAGSFDMIYLDGPFNSGRIFTMQVQGTNVELINPWQELKSIQFYERQELYLADYKLRLELARELLSDRGVLVLQISQKEGHYLKVLLDTVFHRDHFICEVIWKITENPYSYQSQFGLSHESLFFYGRTAHFMKNDEQLFPSIWDDVGFYDVLGQEDTLYPSQKPQKLMRRILEATTREGDLIGDFYCGSGSMPVAAELLGRRWVASDCNVHAVELTKLRLSAFGVQSPVIEMNQETGSDGNSFWQVPLINEKGIHAARTVKIPFPTLALHHGIFVLEHVDWRIWALYNVPHVTMHNGRHVFEWDRIQERVDELLLLPKESFILESFRDSSGTRVRDIFGRSYHFQIRTKTNRQA